MRGTLQHFPVPESADIRIGQKDEKNKTVACGHRTFKTEIMIIPTLTVSHIVSHLITDPFFISFIGEFKRPWLDRYFNCYFLRLLLLLISHYIFSRGTCTPQSIVTCEASPQPDTQLLQ